MVQNKEILIQRKQYTQKLKSWLGQNDLVKIVTGVRHCGKSKLFVLFQKELLKNKIATKNTIISINLEDAFQTRDIDLTYNNNGFLTDYNKLLDYVISKLIPNKMNYVFIDEVQLLENWQLAANALKLIENVDQSEQMLKQVQSDRKRVQNSAKIRTKVQEADCEPSAELFRLWL